MRKLEHVSTAVLGITAVLALGSLAGCSCSGETQNGDGGVGTDGGTGMDGRVLLDGNGADVNAPLDDAWAPIDGNGADVNPPVPDTGAPVDTGPVGIDGNGFDVGPPGCFVAACAGHTYQCGDCIDNDMDGLIDALDPDCLNQCGNNEAGYNPMIPGMGATCNADCFFDQDSGSGDDTCTYNYECDPLGPDRDPAHMDRCGYNPSTTCPATQPMTCLDVCGPLTPNGCDCFGCCEVTPGSGEFVFLGSIPDPGHEPCSPTTLHDPASCRPCTPVAACLNTCGHCELCFGRTTLPADCFPPPPVDAGPPPDAYVPDAQYPDGGHPDAYIPDAYVPPMDSGVPPRCDATHQPCGLPTDPACPLGYFCITGCCTYFG